MTLLFVSLSVVRPQHKVTMIPILDLKKPNPTSSHEDCFKYVNRFPDKTIIIEGRTRKYRITTRFEFILSSIFPKLRLKGKKDDYCIVKCSQMNIPLPLHCTIQDLNVENDARFAGMPWLFS